MDVTRHDSDPAFPGCNHPGAVWPYQANRFALEITLGADHVDHRHPFGDGDDQRHAGCGRFHDCVGGPGRRNEDNRGIGAGFGHRLDFTVRNIGSSTRYRSA